MMNAITYTRVSVSLLDGFRRDWADLGARPPRDQGYAWSCDIGTSPHNYSSSEIECPELVHSTFG
jgi:hypothetical protein